MAFKAILLCASALMVQSVLGCCGGSSGYSSSLPLIGLSNSGCGCSNYGGNYGSSFNSGYLSGNSLNSGCGCSNYGGNYGNSFNSGYLSGNSLNSGCGCNNYGNYGSRYNSGYLSGNSLNSLGLSSGGDFIVTSVGPVVPTGIAVASEIGLSGDLNVCGSMPFLSAVAFEDNLPTSGSGCVDYSCGSGCNVAITSVSGLSGGSYNSLGGCGCRYF